MPDGRVRLDDSTVVQVKMESTYQKFIVPPPRDEDDETKVSSLLNIDIGIRKEKNY